MTPAERETRLREAWGLARRMAMVLPAGASPDLALLAVCSLVGEVCGKAGIPLDVFAAEILRAHGMLGPDER